MLAGPGTHHRRNRSLGCAPGWRCRIPFRADRVITEFLPAPRLARPTPSSPSGQRTAPAAVLRRAGGEIGAHFTASSCVAWPPPAGGRHAVRTRGCTGACRRTASREIPRAVGDPLEHGDVAVDSHREPVVLEQAELQIATPDLANDARPGSQPCEARALDEPVGDHAREPARVRRQRCLRTCGFQRAWVARNRWHGPRRSTRFVRGLLPGHATPPRPPRTPAPERRARATSPAHAGPRACGRPGLPAARGGARSPSGCWRRSPRG